MYSEEYGHLVLNSLHKGSCTVWLILVEVNVLQCFLYIDGYIYYIKQVTFPSATRQYGMGSFVKPIFDTGAVISKVIGGL